MLSICAIVVTTVHINILKFFIKSRNTFLHMPAFVTVPFMNTSMVPSTTRRSPVSVKQVSNNDELLASLTVRQRVFVDEMGIPPSEEFDAFDLWPTVDHMLHYLVSVERQPIATCRVNLALGPGAKLEHMAVLKAARRKGVGLALLNHLERLPALSNLRGPLFCFAMKDKELFYRNSGWVVEEGHRHLQETLIPHVAMIRRRRPCGAASPGSPSLSHIMVRTSDIARARRFYSLLGFQDVSRFDMEGVRGVWIEVSASYLATPPSSFHPTCLFHLLTFFPFSFSVSVH